MQNLLGHTHSVPGGIGLCMLSARFRWNGALPQFSAGMVLCCSFIVSGQSVWTR